MLAWVFWEWLLLAWPAHQHPRPQAIAAPGTIGADPYVGPGTAGALIYTSQTMAMAMAKVIGAVTVMAEVIGIATIGRVATGTTKRVIGTTIRSGIKASTRKRERVSTGTIKTVEAGAAE